MRRAAGLTSAVPKGLACAATLPAGRKAVKGLSVVLVTVGNATQPFSRLLEAVDRLIGEGVFNHAPVLIQCGHAGGFQARHCEQRDFLAMDEFVGALRQAELVIAHGGAGTLFHLLQAGKVPIVMPRRAQYGEHVDDHQYELVQALSEEGRVIPAYEAVDLPAAIEQARQWNGRAERAPAPTIQRLVAEAIEELLSERP